MQLAAPLARPMRRLALPGSRRAWALVLLAVVVLGGAGFLAYQRFFAPAAPAPTGQVVPVRRGSVAATVSATGSVVATHQAKLVFAGSGRIKDVQVNVGDQVTAGQTLATLVSDAAQVKLDTARSQLTAAQLKLQQLTEVATPEELAAAQAAYDAASARMDDVIAGPTAADAAAASSAVVQARANLDDANAKLQTLVSGAAAPDRASAQAALIAAQNTLAAAQAKLDQLQSGPTAADLAAGQSGVDQARATLSSAQAKLDALKAGATDADLAAAQAGLDQAQATVTTARAKLDQARATGGVSTEVAQAQSALAAAESKLHTAHETLDQLTAKLEQANATLASQQSSLDSSRRTADQTCSKLGESSADCSSARARADALEPTILEAQQQVKLLRGDGAWDQLAANKDVLAAQAAYDAAAASLRQAQAAASVPVEIVSAQTAYDSAVSGLTSARAKLDQVRAGATSADLIGAQSALDQARAGLAAAQAKLDQTLAGATDADVVSATTAVTTAQANVDAAQAKVDGLGVSTPQDLQAARAAQTSAEAAVQTAQAKLDQLQSGPTRTDVEAARSALVSAGAALAAKSGSVRPTDLALQQEAVRQAELAVRQAQIDLDSNTLTAPFDGVVASISGNVGESAPSGTTGFITLVDPRNVRVDVTVDETDVARVGVGKSASVTFDAIQGRPFRGKVISIAPNGTLNQGVVTYPVSISLDTRDQVLPAGLTASATITIDEKDDVLVVPNRAVRRQGRDQVVEVLSEDGTPATRPVKTGVQNDQLVEIADGLQEGERVLIAGTTTRAPTLGGGGAPGGPGFGGTGRAFAGGR